MVIEDLIKENIVFNIGTFSPNTSQMLGRIDLGNSNAHNYVVSIAARNGLSSQTTLLRRVNSVWTEATKITRLNLNENKTEIIYERIDPEYPKNVKGEVVW